MSPIVVSLDNSTEAIEQLSANVHGPTVAGSISQLIVASFGDVGTGAALSSKVADPQQELPVASSITLTVNV